MKIFCTLICLISLNILCHSAPFNNNDQGESCDLLEVEGGSSQTDGVYDHYDEFVWKKYEEDRFIFNKGDSNGWRIGTEGQSLYGTSYYFKSSKQNLPLPNTEETWTSRNNGEVTVRCISALEARITTSEQKGCVGQLSLFQGETRIDELVADRLRGGDLVDTIRANENENNYRIDYVKVDGDCCWEFESYDGEIETFVPYNQKTKVPRNFYIYNIYLAEYC